MASKWPEEKIKLLVDLYKEGVTYEEMSYRLDKAPSSVKSMLSTVREQYNWPYRAPKQVKPKRKRGTVITRFDKEFSGPIPCGHWMLTKPWGKHAKVQ